MADQNNNFELVSVGNSSSKNNDTSPPTPISITPDAPMNQDGLDSLNIDGRFDESRENLEKMGGVSGLAAKLGLDLAKGLTEEQIHTLREKFGKNVFPDSPMESYLSMLLGALSDTTLIILIIGASVSIALNTSMEPEHGWIEGTAIFIAVFLVSNISAWNDYSKQLQFRALEETSAKSETANVLRNGSKETINANDIVVGDIIILQAGDIIPADAVMLDNHVITSNESSLTGEPDDMKKCAQKDCFLLSSCTITTGEPCSAVAIGVGTHSRWGKIKANLITEAANTPLQDKLEIMTTNIGYLGMVAALATFIALVANIWSGNDPPAQKEIGSRIVMAFIYSVTIIVVAIPEGLPLAVTISLAYSSRKMYDQNCFIKILAACETMGNATNICSDKTGTLTENKMTVVEGWYADQVVEQDVSSSSDPNSTKPRIPNTFSEEVVKILSQQVALNRSAYLVFKDEHGKDLHTPSVVGNKTEGALIGMIRGWGLDEEVIKKDIFNPEIDRAFSFNSGKKRSTAVYHMPDGTVRIYCKGASEWILRDCKFYLAPDGSKAPLTERKTSEINNHILQMADRALRTLVLAHRDFPSVKDLPDDWEQNPPDNSELCCDCIVGIIDPLRSDVIEAVRKAQEAGIMVRMVTGDNIRTASAIARQCGILTDGIAVEGPDFRKMTPAQVDEILPKLQVMARSSPEDKFLLVTRLNGHNLPENKEQWEKKHDGANWDTDRNLLLPGYQEEWDASRPEGGHVVGVTGDGTNDAPALKAADVGLAMGITGTKVAQGAADVVLRDDKFSTIVNSIRWGRCVFDNIRKFLQFQLTVNLVVLIIDFIAAASNCGTPLNAVQMLWVNLIMDTLGALALGTEEPTDSLLKRKPYKRTASLISWPMRRNILCQAAFQLAMLFTLLYHGDRMFNVPNGAKPMCSHYSVLKDSTIWNPVTNQISPSPYIPNAVGCSTFEELCPSLDGNCYLSTHEYNSTTVSFENLQGFETDCLKCDEHDYRHYTIIFNIFVWCQIFNEYSSRLLFNELNFFDNLDKNPALLFVTVVSVGFQLIIVELGGEWVKTSSLSVAQWFICIGLGALTFPVGFLMRLIPIHEDPNSFFDSAQEFSSIKQTPEKTV